MATVSVRYIVDDVDAAISFYCELLGFEEVMHPAPTFAMLSRGDLRLTFSSPGGPGGGGQAMPDGRSRRRAVGTASLSKSPISPRPSRRCATSGARSATTSSPASAASRSSSRIRQATPSSCSSRSSRRPSCVPRRCPRRTLNIAHHPANRDRNDRPRSGSGPEFSLDATTCAGSASVTGSSAAGTAARCPETRDTPQRHRRLGELPRRRPTKHVGRLRKPAITGTSCRCWSARREGTPRVLTRRALSASPGFRTV